MYDDVFKGLSEIGSNVRTYELGDDVMFLK